MTIAAVLAAIIVYGVYWYYEKRKKRPLFKSPI